MLPLCSGDSLDVWFLDGETFFTPIGAPLFEPRHTLQGITLWKLESKNCCYFKCTLTSEKTLHIPHKNILQYFSTEKLWSLLLSVKRKKKNMYFYNSKNQSKNDQVDICSPQAISACISSLFSIYTYWFSACVCIYRYTYE